MTTFHNPHFQAQEYPVVPDGHPGTGTPKIPSGVVELRVHGVAGGTPEENLGDPHPIKINGDDEAGIYRRRESLNSGPERTVEAYNWSSINSRRTMRALWLVLFPFAASNFAGWLLPQGMYDPRDAGHSWPRSWSPWRNRLLAQTSVRAIALVITAVAMLGMATITVDIVALQCGVKGACGDPWWFGWFDVVRSSSILDGEPTRFAVAGTLVPLAALGGLWMLGKRSTAYERYGAGHSGEKPLGDEPSGRHIDTIRLDSVDFWQSPDTVYVQSWLHTSVALATLTGMLAGTMRVLAPESVHHATFFWLGAASGVWFVVIAVFILLVARMRQVPRSWLRRKDSPRWLPRLTWLPVVVPTGLLLAVAVLGWSAEGIYPTASPVLEPIRNGLIIATLVGLVFLTILGLLTGVWRVLGITLAVGGLWYLVLVTQSGDVGGPPPFVVGVDSPWLWLLGEAIVAAGLLVFVAVRSGATTQKDPTHRHGLIWIVASAGVVSAFAMGASARSGEGPWPVLIVSVAVTVAYVLTALSIRVRAARKQLDLDAPEHGTMRSGACFVLATIALGSILTISAASTVWIAHALGTAVAHSGGVLVADDQIAYGAEAGWFALAAFAGFASLIVLLLARIGALRLFRWDNSVAESICDAYDDDAPPPGVDAPPPCTSAAAGGREHDGWRLAFAERSRTLRLRANILDDIDWVVTGAVMTTLAVLVASVIARVRGGQPGEWLEDAISVATWVLALLAAGVFLVIRSAREDRQLRATIGIIWDVMSFFPRRFHPLAPPCYSERTVIDVRNRIVEYTKAEGAKGKIVLAHSQGTMITAAALLSLRTTRSLQTAPLAVRPNGEELDDLIFVTYGCMLERIFRRAWPDQLRREDLVELKARIEKVDVPEDPRKYPEPHDDARWMNFGRYSDYLGGRTFTGPQVRPTPTDTRHDADSRSDDVMFPDPTRRWRYPGDTSSARTWLHSFNYESDTEDPRFRRHVWRWAEQLDDENT